MSTKAENLLDELSLGIWRTAKLRVLIVKDGYIALQTRWLATRKAKQPWARYLNSLWNSYSFGKTDQFEVGEVAHMNGLRSPVRDESIGPPSRTGHEQRTSGYKFLHSQ